MSSAPEPEKKKRYKYDPLRVHDYRGFKVEERRNAKTGRIEYKVRFQINGRRHYLTNNKKDDLEEMIDEIVYQERRIAKDLPVPEADTSPALADLLDRILPTIEKAHQQKIAERVFKNFQLLLPAGILVKDLKKQHFQTYIDWRKGQIAVQTKKPVQITTVYKELYAVTSALAKGELYFSELEKWRKPELPKSPEKKKSRRNSRRKRVVARTLELDRLLAALRDRDFGRYTAPGFSHRLRLAADLEFRAETGLRRKEVARLQRKQYFAGEKALRQVRRWKTDTVTPFFPLSDRAAEIIDERLAGPPAGGQFIFTANGEPVPSDYRTLKEICGKLDIAYGRYVEDGFIPHDLRHTFATEVISHTDIETARELLGHSNIGQTGDYLHTNEQRLSTAIRRKQGFDLKRELIVIFKETRRRRKKARRFVEDIRKLFEKWT